MDLDAIYKEYESIKQDDEKILFLAKVINYIEGLYTNIGFNPSECSYIDNINKVLKEEIDKTLTTLIDKFKTEIKFLMYYNNEKKHTDWNSWKSKFR